jgi:hypothetical protein
VGTVKSDVSKEVKTDKNKIRIVSTRFFTKYVRILADKFHTGIPEDVITKEILLIEITNINSYINNGRYRTARSKTYKLINRLLQRNIQKKEEVAVNKSYLSPSEINLPQRTKALVRSSQSEKVTSSYRPRNDILQHTQLINENEHQRNINDTINYLYDILIFLAFQKPPKPEEPWLSDEQRKTLYQDYIGDGTMLFKTDNNFIKKLYSCEEFIHDNATNKETAIKYCNLAAEVNLGDEKFADYLKVKFDKDKAIRYLQASIGKTQNDNDVFKLLEKYSGEEITPASREMLRRRSTISFFGK